MLTPLATLAEWFNAQFADATGVVKNGIAFIVLCFAIYKCAKAGLSLAAIIAVTLAGALVMWLFLNGGIADVAALIKASSDGVEQ